MAVQQRTPPYASYAAIMGTFAGALAAAGALGRLLDRDPQCQTPLDLTVLAGATFKAARTRARVATDPRLCDDRECDASRAGRRADRGAGGTRRVRVAGADAQESRLVVKGLPAFYHQSCIRYSVRVSTVDAHFAAVFFRFVRGSGPCRPFDGQVLLKRLTPTRWTKIGEGSSWPCRVRGVPTRVVRDLFGACAP